VNGWGPTAILEKDTQVYPLQSGGDGAVSYPRIAIVIPVYDDEMSLQELLRRVDNVVAGHGATFHFIIVDDGSPVAVDSSRLRSITQLPLETVTLTRNVGHQRAIAIGLSYVVALKLADIIVIMDADGEDRPEDIIKLLNAVRVESRMTIAVAQRARRSEALPFVLGYQIYRGLFLLLTGMQINFGNFCAMSFDSAKRLVAMSELWINLPATVLRSRLPLIQVPTERGRRYSGQPKMRRISLVLHGFSTIAVFTDRVLTRLAVGAVGAIGFAGIASVIAIGLKLFGRASPGWMTNVLGTSILVTTISAALFLVGLLSVLTGGMLFVPTPISAYRCFVADATGERRGLTNLNAPQAGPEELVR
jgi:polyisoprenyl-phosphate glycosyltransferase